MRRRTIEPPPSPVVPEAGHWLPRPMGLLTLTSAFASAVARSPSACRLGRVRRAAPSTARGLVRPPRARPRPAPRARGLGGYSADGSDAARLPGGDPGPAVGALAPLLQPRSGLPARAHTRLLCRGRRAYELANHAVSARSRARGSSSTSRRGHSCAPHRASVECRAPQTFRHRVEWCGGAEPVESEHRAETRVYNTCFQTQLKTRNRSGGKDSHLSV